MMEGLLSTSTGLPTSATPAPEWAVPLLVGSGVTEINRTCWDSWPQRLELSTTATVGPGTVGTAARRRRWRTQTSRQSGVS